MDSEFTVYTSNFYSLDKIPDKYERISIALSSPSFFKGGSIKCFMPTWELVNKYKSNSITDEEYVEEYLSLLSKRRDNILLSIEKLRNKNIVLLCHEPSNKICHRKIVSKILTEFDIRSCEFII